MKNDFQEILYGEYEYEMSRLTSQNAESYYLLSGKLHPDFSLIGSPEVSCTEQ